MKYATSNVSYREIHSISAPKGFNVQICISIPFQTYILELVRTPLFLGFISQLGCFYRKLKMSQHI